MLRSNKNSVRLIDILVMAFIMIIIGLVGMIINKTSIRYSIANNQEIYVETKDFKADVDDTLVAYEDNIAISVEPATVREKISSRANNARRSRGEQANYVSISDVSISVQMDLNVRTGLSKQDFINLIASVPADTSGFFEENAGIIYDLCEIYSINEIFFCGLISAESSWEIAQNHRNSHNYISLMSGNGLMNFSSVEEGLEAAASTLHYNYLTPGGRFYCGSTLEGVRTRFCPVNPGWTSLVFSRMSQII